ncbi:hypothetical protein JJQ59_20085 [Cupriavidus necator]|uniref:hypothetical protein n=1 Tax=Cupriavidus necator TaxID=106590 RepID=UPI0011BDCC1D|nr:hypothetical protein [Cupriavidus necator]QQX87729.1 hypothetical protein JJQ59_20085 [Cupriavidus necator]
MYWVDVFDAHGVAGFQWRGRHIATAPVQYSAQIELWGYPVSSHLEHPASVNALDNSQMAMLSSNPVQIHRASEAIQRAGAQMSKYRCGPEAKSKAGYVLLRKQPVAADGERPCSAELVPLA